MNKGKQTTYFTLVKRSYQLQKYSNQSNGDERAQRGIFTAFYFGMSYINRIKNWHKQKERQIYTPDNFLLLSAGISSFMIGYTILATKNKSADSSPITVKPTPPSIRPKILPTKLSNLENSISSNGVTSTSHDISSTYNEPASSVILNPVNFEPNILPDQEQQQVSGDSEPIALHRNQTKDYYNSSSQDKDIITDIVNLKELVQPDEFNRSLKQEVLPHDEDLINRIQCMTDTPIMNWSATHIANPSHIYYPGDVLEVMELIGEFHIMKQKIRPTGSGLSPNGLSFSDNAMVSLAHMDKIIHVDLEKMQVSVEAGITIEKLTQELKKHKLTLPNFASIQQQQLAGLIQVGAHGTGLHIPPMDMMVVELDIMTPEGGMITLKRGSSGFNKPSSSPSFQSPKINSSLLKNINLLNYATVGLGTLGVVTRYTIQCVPAHTLVEQATLLTYDKLLTTHLENITANKHMKYLWYPYCDDINIVMIAANPIDTYDYIKEQATEIQHPTIFNNRNNPCVSMQQLYFEINNSVDNTIISDIPDNSANLSINNIHNKSRSHQEGNITQLRQDILAINPLDANLVKQVNRAELEYWGMSQMDKKIDSSEKVLAFDCGGRQLVFEIAFKVGNLKSLSSTDSPTLDILFMKEWMELIRKHQLPAPGPIEQRWSKASSSYLSPAYSEDPDDYFTWVGIIMYLTDDDEELNSHIIAHFNEMVRLFAECALRYDARAHWAKIETDVLTKSLKDTFYKHLNNEEFKNIKAMLDPYAILSNEFTQTVLE